MKIAYIGNFEPPYSTENDVKSAFEKLGHEVLAIQENSKFTLNLSELDLVLITSTWDNAIDLNEWLGIVRHCALLGIPTATLHLDTFWGTSRGGRKWWLNPMFHTAYIFTADGDYQKEWKLYGKNHIWLPPAVRHDAAHYGQYLQNYAFDVAFVGSNGQGYHEDVWGYRKELVDNLRAMCQRNNWSWHNPGGDHPKIDRNNDMNNFYASTKVTVGDSLCLKKEHSKYWSDRVPEATGRGGFLIMPQINAVQDIYGTSIPMYEWGNWSQLEGMVKFYLDNVELTLKVKDKAYRITKKEHTYVQRAETILKEVGL